MTASADLIPDAAAKVVNLESPPAAAVKLDQIKASLEQHKPAVLFLCQVGLASCVQLFWQPLLKRASIICPRLLAPCDPRILAASARVSCLIRKQRASQVGGGKFCHIPVLSTHIITLGAKLCTAEVLDPSSVGRQTHGRSA